MAFRREVPVRASPASAGLVSTGLAVSGSSILVLTADMRPEPVLACAVDLAERLGGVLVVAGCILTYGTSGWTHSTQGLGFVVAAEAYQSSTEQRLLALQEKTEALVPADVGLRFMPVTGRHRRSLGEVAAALQPGLAVVEGKRHSRLRRWVEKECRAICPVVLSDAPCEAPIRLH